MTVVWRRGAIAWLGGARGGATVGWLRQFAGRGLVVALGLGLALSGVGGGPGLIRASAVQAGKLPVTSSGFACPEPRPRIDFSSRQIDLLIWSQYVPPDLIDCFE